MALNYTSENESNISKIDNILKKNIAIDPPTRSKKTGSLDDNPDSYYFLIYHIVLGDKNDFGDYSEKFYHFIIKSDGKFELNNVLSIPKWYDF